MSQLHLSRVGNRLLYLVVRSLSQIIVKGFFRDVSVMGMENVPVYGPVIFVGNHNNQFVDATMLMAVLPRRVRFLVADVSLKRAIVGTCAKLAGCISVKRPQDMVYAGMGKLYWKKDSTCVKGIGSHFTLDVKPGDRIKVDKVGDFTIEEVDSDEQLQLTTPITVAPPTRDFSASPSSSPSPSPSLEMESFEGELTVSTARYKILPKIDQSEVYEAISEALKNGSTICVFPEGGSHDRTDLLPLKPGVAIMALSSVFDGAQDVMIVPIGCNYFEGHKMMGSATIEIGRPREISSDLVEMYKVDRRAAVVELLRQIEESLRNCIIAAPDYKTLKNIRLCSTLYPPERMMLSSHTYHALNHSFSRLFAENEKSEELEELRRDLADYSNMLKTYGIPDHEVWQLKQSFESAFLSLAQKALLLLVCALAASCLVAIWAPLKATSDFLAERHRTKALSKSSVKILGMDVVASYKIIAGLIFFPFMTTITGLLSGLYFGCSLGGILLAMVACFTVIPWSCYWSHRCSTKIIPLCRQIRSLSLAIFGSVGMLCDVEKEVISFRIQMQIKVRSVMDKLGPKTDETFIEGMERFLPKAVVDVDTRRLQRCKGEFIPLLGRSYFECREEII